MRGGGGGVAGSQPMSTAVHITWHGAQINFGDLPPYLTYDSEGAFYKPLKSIKPTKTNRRSRFTNLLYFLYSNFLITLLCVEQEQQKPFASCPPPPPHYVDLHGVVWPGAAGAHKLLYRTLFLLLHSNCVEDEIAPIILSPPSPHLTTRWMVRGEEWRQKMNSLHSPHVETWIETVGGCFHALINKDNRTRN